MRITPLVASTFRSDGGAMFGLVPKPMWSQLIAADDRNTIPQNANVLLIECADGSRGLVDTGCGAAALFSERDAHLHALGSGWPLEEALRREGVLLEQIDFVVLTHAHWDHAGGLMKPGEETPVPSFPRASVYLHAREWDCAMREDPLLGKSYPPSVEQALAAIPSSQRRLVKGDDEEILPGLHMVRSGGHTEGHCAIVFEGEGLTFNHPGAPEPGTVKEWVFAADVCPTRHHLRMVFQTAYDTYPLDTRAWKMKWLPRIEQGHGMLLFCHDPDACGATLEPGKRGAYKIAETWPIAASA